MKVRPNEGVHASTGDRLEPGACCLGIVYWISALEWSDEAAPMCVQNQAEILGKVKGKSVPMVMHHSRNSQQKAWDETLVLALAGMGRLLRGHLPTLVTMPAFPQARPLLALHPNPCSPLTLQPNDCMRPESNCQSMHVGVHPPAGLWSGDASS